MNSIVIRDQYQQTDLKGWGRKLGGQSRQGFTQPYQVLAKLLQDRPLGRNLRQQVELLWLLDRLPQLLFRTSNSEPLAVEQILDPQQKFNILALVEPLLGPTFSGAQGREFTFPIAQDVRLYSNQFGDFSNLEVKLVWEVQVHGSGWRLSSASPNLLRR